MKYPCEYPSNIQNTNHKQIYMNYVCTATTEREFHPDLFINNHLDAFWFRRFELELITCELRLSGMDGWPLCYTIIQIQHWIASKWHLHNTLIWCWHLIRFVKCRWPFDFWHRTFDKHALFRHRLVRFSYSLNLGVMLNSIITTSLSERLSCNNINNYARSHHNSIGMEAISCRG